MGSGSRLQHSECGRVRDAPMPNLDDDIDSNENLQPPIMSGPAPLAGVVPLPAPPPQATSKAAPGAQATSTASPAGQATPSTAIAAAIAPRASTTSPPGQAHSDAAHDSTEPETTRIPKPCTQTTTTSTSTEDSTRRGAEEAYWAQEQKIGTSQRCLRHNNNRAGRDRETSSP